VPGRSPTFNRLAQRAAANDGAYELAFSAERPDEGNHDGVRRRPASTLRARRSLNKSGGGEKKKKKLVGCQSGMEMGFYFHASSTPSANWPIDISRIESTRRRARLAARSSLLAPVIDHEFIGV
jgi:hypothetical protein